MPRNPKQVPGTRSYGTKSRYTAESLEKAIEEIKSNKIGQREASRVYNIPRQTLVNKLRENHTRNVGRPTAFTIEEESSFVEHCVYLGRMGIPISLFDLRCVVKSYLDNSNIQSTVFKNNFPGWDWGKYFLERHRSKLRECFGKNISQKRAAVSEDIVCEFFDNFKMEIEGVLPQNLFNFDETGFHDNPKSKKLLFPRKLRHPETVMNETKTCYTAVFCGNAVGQMLPPYFIFKGKQKWSEWLADGPPGSRMNISQNGWIDQNVFEDWVQFHFVPWVQKNAAPGKKVLICDNLSAHISIKALEVCKENDISFLCFPPNSTHLLQPLDLTYFASLKTEWRSVLLQWRSTSDGKKKISLPKGTFVSLVKQTLEKQSDVEEIVRKGFEKAGLHPLNDSKVIEALPSYARNLNEVVNNVSTEFIDYVKNVRETDLSLKTKTKNFKLPVVPGKSVSLEEVKEFYEKKEKEKEERDKLKEEKAMLKKKKLEERSAKIMKIRSGPKTRGGLRRRGEGTVRTLKNIENDTLEEDTNIEEMLDKNISWNTCLLEEDLENVNHSLLSIDSVNIDNEPYFLSDFQVDDHVIVQYEGKLFPGKVTEINLFENSPTKYKVSCMVRKGKKWTWPERPDEMFYERHEIVKKISEDSIVIINKRGMFDVKERLLYSEDEFTF